MNGFRTPAIHPHKVRCQQHRRFFASHRLVNSRPCVGAMQRGPRFTMSRTVFLLSPSRWLISRYDCPSPTSFQHLGREPIRFDSVDRVGGQRRRRAFVRRRCRSGRVRATGRARTQPGPPLARQSTYLERCADRTAGQFGHQRDIPGLQVLQSVEQIEHRTAQRVSSVTRMTSILRAWATARTSFRSARSSLAPDAVSFQTPTIL